jgi:diacylglycerol kinase
MAARELEAVMNPIEKVMVRRSQHFKVAVAVAVLVLVLVLWASGSSIQSLWLTPVIIFVLWVAIQLGWGYHDRHHAA